MKTPAPVLCAILATAFAATALPTRAAEKQSAPASAPAAAPALEFAAYVTVGQEQLFVLYDVASKSPSRWLKLGQTWADYTLVSFDGETESIALRREKSELKLRLRTAKTGVAASPVEIHGLVRGSYTLLDGTVLYSTDAQLRVGSGFLISSPSGLMVSDDQQKFIGGDLTIETNSGTIMQMQDAILEVDKGLIRAKGPVQLMLGDGYPRARVITNSISIGGGELIVHASPQQDSSTSLPPPPSVPASAPAPGSP